MRGKIQANAPAGTNPAGALSLAMCGDEFANGRTQVLWVKREQVRDVALGDGDGRFD